MVPVVACSSAVELLVGGAAGWMIRVFASPTFASRLKILTLSISRRPASAPPLTPNVEHAAEAALEVARGRLVGGVDLSPGS